MTITEKIKALLPTYARAFDYDTKRQRLKFMVKEHGFILEKSGKQMLETQVDDLPPSKFYRYKLIDLSTGEHEFFVHKNIRDALSHALSYLAKKGVA